jgi:hypothetical protein
MDAVAGASSEPRKEWVTPELQKIDIDQTSAAGGGIDPDGAVAATT